MTVPSSSNVLPTKAELDRASQQAAERVARMARANARLGALSITETAANGAIRATVSTSGAVRKVELVGANAARLSATEAVTQLTACIQRAQSRIAQCAAEIMANELGNDPAIAQVVNSYRERFPAPPEPMPGWQAQPSGPAGGYPGPPAAPPLAPPRPAPPPPTSQQARPAPRPSPTRPGQPVADDDWENRSFLRPV